MKKTITILTVLILMLAVGQVWGGAEEEKATSQTVWQYKAIDVCNLAANFNQIKQCLKLNFYSNSCVHAFIPALDEQLENLNKLLSTEYKGWQVHSFPYGDCTAIIQRKLNAHPNK